MSVQSLFSLYLLLSFGGSIYFPEDNNYSTIQAPIETVFVPQHLLKKLNNLSGTFLSHLSPAQGSKGEP